MKNNNLYEKEFVCGKTTISRKLLETLSEPFNTENASDKTMQEIADNIEKEMKDFYEWEANGMLSTTMLKKKWYGVLKSSAIRYNIPQYNE